jgi:hypothetical protein
MESLDLNGLAKSLPVSNFKMAEKELLNNFKAAALSITTLYRSSRHASKRAYNTGYAAACQDLTMMIQQGVSASGIAPSSNDNSHDGEMTIGRILDWIEARMEAVKSREDEEDEDEEREKEKERPRLTPPAAISSLTDVPDSVSLGPAPLTPHSPVLINNVNLPNRPTSPSPTVTPSRPTIHPYAAQRFTKARPPSSRKDLSDASPSSTTSFGLSDNLLRAPIAPVTTHPDDFSAGAKRRHAVMMMLDSAPSAAAVDVSSSPGSSTDSPVSSGSGNTRRRTRSQRFAGHPQAQAQSGDSMDIEEDGPQRKRIARR